MWRRGSCENEGAGLRGNQCRICCCNRNGDNIWLTAGRNMLNCTLLQALMLVLLLVVVLLVMPPCLLLFVPLLPSLACSLKPCKQLGRGPH